MSLSPLTEPIVIADERRPRFTPNITRASTVATARHKLFVTASQRSSPGIGGHQGLDCGEHNRCSRGGIVPRPPKIKREVRRNPAEITQSSATTVKASRASTAMELPPTRGTDRSSSRAIGVG